MSVYKNSRLGWPHFKGLWTAILKQGIWQLALVSFMFNPVSAQNFNRATMVETQPVQNAMVAPKTEIQGRVKSGPLELVTAPFSGTVRLNDVRVGDVISKGQIIARQDRTDIAYQRQLLSVQLDEADARLSQLQNELVLERELSSVSKEKLSLLDAKLQRAEKLSVNKTISTEAFDTVKSAFLAAREQALAKEKTVSQLSTQIKATQLSLKKLQIQNDKLRQDHADADIKSPVSGQITELVGNDGIFMREGENIAGIRTDKNVEIEADIPADYLASLTQGDVFEAWPENLAILQQQDNGQKIRLMLRAILPSQNSRTGTRPVRFVPVEGSLPELIQAENAALMIAIPTTRPKRLTLVPQDAVIPVNGGHVVFTANEGRAERRIVQLGGTDKDMVIILSGLQTGEMVITKGNEVLSDGSAINDGSAGPNKGADGKKEWGGKNNASMKKGGNQQ